MQFRLIGYALFFLLTIAIGAHAQSAVYQPLGTWADPQADVFKKWDFSRQLLASKSAARPQLAGFRGKNLELLQDALQRRNHKEVTTDARARLLMLRLIMHRPGKNVLNGAMAEAIYADNHPEMNYVKKANASQHDFTQARPGGGRINTQVKFHENGDPKIYMRDMKRDSQATKFAVPNDHVQSLKMAWETEYYRCKALGDIDGANKAGRQIGRVDRIGANSSEILQARDDAVSSAARERYSTYVSFGASLALALSPTVWDWSMGDITGDKALYRTARALSLLGVGIGTDTLLLTIRQGALRGTLRGNVIVGTAVTITEVTWLLYEHGWSHAFYQPSFYEMVVGSVSSIGIGFTAGLYATAASGPTPWAPVIGLGVGTVAGTVAYVGGRYAARSILELVAPELLQQQEQQKLNAVKNRIAERIEKQKEWPPK